MKIYTSAIGILLILVNGLFPLPSFSQDTLAFKPVGFEKIEKIIEGTFKNNLNYKIYLPNGDRESFPVVLFINGVGSDVTQWNQYIDWPKAVAAKKMAGIAYEVRRENAYEDSIELLNLLVSGKLSNRLDKENVLLWMCSSNGDVGTKILMDERYPQIKGASMYYPAPPENPKFRTGIKVELIRAGKDSYGLNSRIDKWLIQALENDLHIEMVNFSGGRHAFDTYDEELPQTQEIIKNTLQFLYDLAYNNSEVSNPGTTPGRLMKLLRSGDYNTAEKLFYENVNIKNISKDNLFFNGLYNANSLSAMSNSLLNKKNYEAAKFPLNWALKLSPKHPNNHDNIAEFYFKIGNESKALEHSQLALKYLETFNLPNKQFKEAIRKAAQNRIKTIADK